MSILFWIIPLAISFFVASFWLWMFHDMTSNSSLPPCFITFTANNDHKLDWTIAFVFLNAVTAGYYYFNVHKNR